MSNSRRADQRKILIIGGGFAGVACAQRLAKRINNSVEITLVSATPHFEYHAALYRIASGGNPLEVCVPLREIFQHTQVRVVKDTIVTVDLELQLVRGESGSRYAYDELILALGSQTDYFQTPGLAEQAFTLKNTADALKLKRHFHTLLTACDLTDKRRQLCKTHCVVIGGGPTGTELAGALAVYLRAMAQRHGVDSSMVTIDLIQSAGQLLPQLPREVASQVERKLRSLGVNIYFNRRILKSTALRASIEGVNMSTSTIIWAAGVRGHQLLAETVGLQLSPKGKVLVTPHLRARGQRNVYVLGDCAQTPQSGMAQTALYDGNFVANTITAELTGHVAPRYSPPQPWNAVPIGYGWAAVTRGNFIVYGWLGWLIRRWLDLHVFMSIVKPKSALELFLNGRTQVESCAICSQLATENSDAYHETQQSNLTHT